LHGSVTQMDYVPEQVTDFIFCTVGEEHGFIGSVALLALYAFLLLRVVHIGENQRSKFTRIYAYCVAGILFFHFTINIGMTMGMLPVIGIPLPFLSYGGSSLLSFTVLLAVLVKMGGSRSL
jgi:rod shape determining protein RodA